MVALGPFEGELAIQRRRFFVPRSCARNIPR
jgi:hypothetical protein